ncbi:MAG: ATP-binding protein [Methanospirillum sp.]
MTSTHNHEGGPRLDGEATEKGHEGLPRLSAEEAAETLTAIRLGQVDAFLIATALGDRVYTLQGSEHPYLIYVRSMSEGAVTTAPDGTILFTNDRFAELVGAPREQLIGTPFSRYVCPGDVDKTEALLRDAAGDRLRGEVELCPVGGSGMPVYLSVSPYGSGEAGGFCIVVTDLSEQKRTAALVESAELTQSILERAGDAIVVLGADGRIALANQAAHRLAGSNPLLRPFGEAFPLVPAQEGGAETLAACGGISALDTAGAPAEYVLRPPSGPPRTLLVNAASVHGLCDEPAGCVLCMTDISAQKENERRLARALADAASSNRELQQFAYIASHDLQEPLRMVSSYLQLLERRYGNELDQDAREFIGFAVEGAQRMQQQIMDLLTYSRVTSRGRSPIPVDPASALAEAITRLELRVAETGAEISIGPMPVVPADPSQLSQVFQNLIGNALTFRSSDPPRIRVEAVEEGDAVRFSVSDNGIGIAPEYHDRIFHMFQRLHPRDRYPGSGIGLAIVQRIVARHGGRVWLESEEGKGSTFFFTIPLTPPGEGA